ncbi:DUF551 domain-containing protein [Klebsiella quasipneumoniae]|uniref:DUF551 domain-containing protein n=1 Tax=Klebsiella quasipneumoniae TaxID=1463165 RepID=UPI003C6CC77B
MTKSTITRERLLEIIVTGPEASGAEQNELARIALSAMDGESECLPLDYLQGRKDGLEWASQLAEANHPETGDWLYDDPIELAKAIRKGPDMPPAQPVADSEPDRNPVLAYADSYRDMAKQGVESVPIWSVITDLERNIAPLYRHAQPAPVVPDELLKEYLRLVQCMLSDYRDGNYGNAQRWIRHIAKASDDFERKHGISPWEMARKTCRAAMPQELQKSAGADVICRSNENAQAVEVQSLTSINPAPDLVSLQKKAESIIGNYPGIPDCWCRTCRPVVLNDMRFVVCPDCGNKRCPRANDHRNSCTGSNEPGQEGSSYQDTPREVK